MKNKLLLSLLALGFVQLCSGAVVTVNQYTSPDYLQKTGYSKISSDVIQVEKARANGQEYYTNDELKYKKMWGPMKFLRRFYVYTDPAAEDYSFYHHDTYASPSYTDL